MTSLSHLAGRTVLNGGTVTMLLISQCMFFLIKASGRNIELRVKFTYVYDKSLFFERIP